MSKSRHWLYMLHLRPVLMTRILILIYTWPAKQQLPVNMVCQIGHIMKTSFNIDHPMGKFSRRQTYDIFPIFPRKKDLTVHANCLLRRQFALTVRSYFLGKIRKIFEHVICWNFYPACKVLMRMDTLPRKKFWHGNFCLSCHIKIVSNTREATFCLQNLSPFPKWWQNLSGISIHLKTFAK